MIAGIAKDALFRQTHCFSPGSNVAQSGGPEFLNLLPLAPVFLGPCGGTGGDLGKVN